VPGARAILLNRLGFLHPFALDAGILALALSVTPLALWAQGALPIQFETLTTPGEFTIYFTDLQYSADQVWFVSGSCESASEAAVISVQDYAYSADLTVFLARYAFEADQVVCVANPGQAPQAFWDAYPQK
jgi:hypothetical protein